MVERKPLLSVGESADLGFSFKNIYIFLLYNNPKLLATKCLSFIYS